MERKPSPADEVLAQAAARAAETDPVLSELDGVLDADPLYQQVCAKLDGLRGGEATGEVLLRMLLVKYLYDWSEQQTAEQVQDSLVLRWFCRLGMQPAPTANSVSQGQVRCRLPRWRRWRTGWNRQLSGPERARVGCGPCTGSAGGEEPC